MFRIRSAILMVVLCLVTFGNVAARNTKTESEDGKIGQCCFRILLINDESCAC